MNWQFVVFVWGFVCPLALFAHDGELLKRKDAQDACGFEVKPGTVAVDVKDLARATIRDGSAWTRLASRFRDASVAHVNDILNSIRNRRWPKLVPDVRTPAEKEVHDVTSELMKAVTEMTKQRGKSGEAAARKRVDDLVKRADEAMQARGRERHPTTDADAVAEEYEPKLREARSAARDALERIRREVASMKILPFSRKTLLDEVDQTLALPDAALDEVRPFRKFGLLNTLLAEKYYPVLREYDSLVDLIGRETDSLQKKTTDILSTIRAERRLLGNPNLDELRDLVEREKAGRKEGEALPESAQRQERLLKSIETLNALEDRGRGLTFLRNFIRGQGDERDFYLLAEKLESPIERARLMGQYGDEIVRALQFFYERLPGQRDIVAKQKRALEHLGDANDAFFTIRTLLDERFDQLRDLRRGAVQRSRIDRVLAGERGRVPLVFVVSTRRGAGGGVEIDDLKVFKGVPRAAWAGPKVIFTEGRRPMESATRRRDRVRAEAEKWLTDVDETVPEAIHCTF